MDEIFSNVVEETIMKRPNMKLSTTGVFICWCYFLRKAWPDVDAETSLKWFEDYLSEDDLSNIKTLDDVELIVKEYINEFGEHND